MERNYSFLLFYFFHSPNNMKYLNDVCTITRMSFSCIKSKIKKNENITLNRNDIKNLVLSATIILMNYPMRKNEGK